MVRTAEKARKPAEPKRKVSGGHGAASQKVKPPWEKGRGQQDQPTNHRQNASQREQFMFGSDIDYLVWLTLPFIRPTASISMS